jgi:hypothetical protein
MSEDAKPIEEMLSELNALDGAAAPEQVEQVEPPPTEQPDAEDTADLQKQLDAVLDEPEPEETPAEDELSRLRERMRKMESDLGRVTGENGYLRSRLNVRGPVDTPPPEPVVYTDPDSAAAATAAAQGSLMEPDEVSGIFEDELAAFASRNPDIEKFRDGLERLAPTVARPIKLAASTGNREFFRTVVAEQLGNLAREARSRDRRQADQMRGVDEAKRRATISGSGSPPPPPARAKTLDEMSVDDLARELDRQAPPHQSRRR